MAINFNDASGGFGGLIPDKTICVVQVVIDRSKAGAGEHGELTRASTGTEMLVAKFTVVSGEYAQKWFYHNFIVDETKRSAKGRSLGQLKLILDSAYNLDPKDLSSPATVQMRNKDYVDFDGLRFVAEVGVEGEKTENGATYAAKNVLAGVITNDHPDWGKYGPVPQAQSAPSATAPATAPGSSPVVPPMPVEKPKWAED